MDAWLFEDLIRVFSLGSRQVLAGEEADITSSMLKSDDADTPAEDVYYNVESPTSGMVAFKDFPEEAAVNFTQAQIDNGEVIFIHEGDDLHTHA